MQTNFNIEQFLSLDGYVNDVRKKEGNYQKVIKALKSSSYHIVS